MFLCGSSHAVKVYLPDKRVVVRDLVSISSPPEFFKSSPSPSDEPFRLGFDFPMLEEEEDDNQGNVKEVKFEGGVASEDEPVKSQ